MQIKGMKTIMIVFIMIFSSASFSQDVQLLNFIPSACDHSEDASRILTRIISQNFHGDTLEIEVATTAICCVGFEPAISFQADTLNLILMETGDFCDCFCCYQFIFFISGLNRKQFGVKLWKNSVLYDSKEVFSKRTIELSDEKYRTYPISFELLNGDTINYTDKYDFKQGKWIQNITTKEAIINREGFYINNQCWEGTDTTRYLDGNFKSILKIKNGYIISNVSYYENGNKESERRLYENGENAEFVSYFENGSKQIQYIYDQSGRLKVEIMWYENGNIRKKILH